jgi:glycosyltransferase involved in cell wall biosynthesis
MRVLLAHPGTQHSFRLAVELNRRGLLGEFWTGFALREGSFAAAVAGLVRGWPIFGGMNSRILREIDASRVHTLPWNEICALARLRFGGSALPVMHERNRRFQEAIPDDALQRSDAIIAFDTSAWRLAERAAGRGRPLILDRTIAHAAGVAPFLEALSRRYPQWADSPQARPPCLVAAEDREHSLAARIVVGGSFARDTLVASGVDPAKIRVNPYGVDWAEYAAAAEAASSSPPGRPLRFLFAGSVIARKGVPLLIEAWQRLAPRNAELWLAGHCGKRERALIPRLPGLRLLGRVPHHDIPRLYAQTDVFILPSLIEGFALVLLEALASGLPIISTRHTGAIELVTDPLLGCIIEAGSVEAIEAALRHYLAQPPERRQVRAVAAALAQPFSWTSYGDRWAALLQELP